MKELLFHVAKNICIKIESITQVWVFVLTGNDGFESHRDAARSHFMVLITS